MASDMLFDSFESLGNISGIPSMDSADLQEVIRAVAKADSSSINGQERSAAKETTEGGRSKVANAFAHFCQLKSSELQQRQQPLNLPTEAELGECITAIRLRLEQSAAAESSCDKRGKSGQSIEQLSMQLKIISRDYHVKLCSYIQTFQATTATQKELLDERCQMLPTTEQNALESKTLAMIRQVHDVVQRALSQLERDATDLYEEFRNQHLKKKEKLPDDSTEKLKEWLNVHWIHPYPTSGEKKELMQQTGLSLKQINQWFINARVRVWRPAVSLMMTEK